jgi:phage tail-like protein
MTDRCDPYGAFNFLLEIDGETVAGFTECSGVSSEAEAPAYRQGNEPTWSQKLPGLIKHYTTLKRGIAGDLSLWNWRESIVDGLLYRKAVTIVLLDRARNSVMRISLQHAWPCRWEGPWLKAKSDQVAIEVLALAHEQLDVQFYA